MENDGPPSLERVQRWKLAKANWDQFQHLCSTRLQQSAIADADDPMSFFISILKDIAEKTIPKTSAVPKRFNGFLTFAKMHSKSATGSLRGSNVNQPRVI